MLKEIITLIALSSIPIIELKVAAPIAILSGTVNLPFGMTGTGLGINPFIVFGIVLITNISLGILSFNFLHRFDKRLKMSRMSRKYIKILERYQRKMKKSVEKYGIFSLIFFIGAPLPGSGVCTGSLAAFVSGMSKKQFYISNIIGVLISAAAVTIITVTGAKII